MSDELSVGQCLIWCMVTITGVIGVAILILAICEGVFRRKIDDMDAEEEDAA